MGQGHITDFAAELEELALKVVMLKEDDMTALGALLNELDRLKAVLEPLGVEAARKVLADLEGIVNALVLGEMENLVQGQELLNRGVGLLLTWAQTGTWPGPEEYCASHHQVTQGTGAPEAGEGAAQEASPPAADWIDDPELMAGFLQEAHEHLEGIETRLVFLEQHPEDLEAINAIFRPFHTIKGVAGFLNLTQIQELGHGLETVLDQVRSGHLGVSRDLVNLILAGVDLLKEMLADLQEAMGTGRALKVFNLAHFKATLQSAAIPSSPAPRLGDILLEQGEIRHDDLEDALEAQRRQGGDQPLGQILIDQGKVPPETVAKALVHQLGQSRPAADAQVPETVKISLAKVDNLVDLMGELVIIQSQVRQSPQLAQVADQKLARDLGQMTRITSELQKISMSMRMIPIGVTFRKMVRLVRDLAQKVEKSVALHLEGEDTEIDRNMVEAIYDPLVHLVRNSVDHGLEPPGERVAAGKDPEGRVCLKAYHRGGNLIIEIADDGRGLDRGAILARAKERGLISGGVQLHPGQIDHLIFEPGFSTAQVVTDISGRGVGLDVVRQTVERLRGKIDINSIPGQGCRLTLRLPLTLAIIDGMVVRVGQERYVLPAVGVRETLRPSCEDCFTVAGQGELIRVRQRLLPLVRLHRLFNVGQADISPDAALVLVVEHEGAQQAFLVDEILGKQEVVIKSLGQFFQKLPGLAGGTILGDGRVGLILDLAGLMDRKKTDSCKGDGRVHS
jgi:two-component system chemotaxis sensor kinase CheA